MPTMVSDLFTWQGFVINSTQFSWICVRVFTTNYPCVKSDYNSQTDIQGGGDNPVTTHEHSGQEYLQSTVFPELIVEFIRGCFSEHCVAL